EPWFSVNDEDVFPEEFPSFLGLDGELFETFCRHHGDLFDTRFWREAQRRNRQGEVLEFFPYSDRRKLRASRAPAARAGAERLG
ncbi:MAG: isocitrate dehydrogenase kinase/phosphatase-domain containing protein, partial [Thermoanaerobaculia bacterium]